MSTKYRLAEQIHRMLAGSDPSAGSRWDIREIILLVGQVINSRLKLSHFQEQMAAGETIPNGVILAKYTGINASSFSEGRSKITLPATPINLPRNMGIYHVGPENNPSCGYIPLLTGQYGQVKTLVGMSDMLGQISYEPWNNELVLSKEVDPVIDHVLLLAIKDIEALDEWEVLPIPSDMESGVIEEVVQRLSQRGEPNKIVESITAK